MPALTDTTALIDAAQLASQLGYATPESFRQALTRAGDAGVLAALAARRIRIGRRIRWRASTVADVLAAAEGNG